jgi:hypothetical protein
MEPATFRVRRLWQQIDAKRLDVSHLRRHEAERCGSRDPSRSCCGLRGTRSSSDPIPQGAPTMEPATFRVRRLWQQIDAKRLDVSHLIDRTYGDVSRSPRGTSWNLAIG